MYPKQKTIGKIPKTVLFGISQIKKVYGYREAAFSCGNQLNKPIT